MKKRKLKLEQFKLIKGKQLDRQSMLKITGGDEEEIKLPPTHTNAPNYSLSAELNIDIETNKER